MIVENGHIRIVAEVGGGYDDHGNPIEVTDSAGDPIPCNYVRNGYQDKGRFDGGEYTTASYTILIEYQKFEPCRFRLYTTDNVLLGEYEVSQKGIVNLSAVGEIQLTV